MSDPELIVLIAIGAMVGIFVLGRMSPEDKKSLVAGMILVGLLVVGFILCGE